MMEPSKIPEIVEIDVQKISELKREADIAPLKRARYCLHRSTNDFVQEMVIAFRRGSYVRPHRHSQKSESFHLMEGGVMVLFFDDQGILSHRIKMEQPGGTLIFRNHSHLWHTLVLLTEHAVVHEIATGPFVKEEGEFAPWSPAPDSRAEVDHFLERMEAICL
jgi:cupin fold WbuC family metalloprotein